MIEIILGLLTGSLLGTWWRYRRTKKASPASSCSEAVAAAAKVPNDGLADALTWTESYLAEIKRRMNQNDQSDATR